MAIVLSLSLTAVASAKSLTAELRVVGKGNKVVTEQSVKTGAKVSFKASPKATCFGAKDSGSGKSVSVKPNTAMGLLARAAQSTGALRPLLVTDAFSFGLGICGIGSNVASGGKSWYLKVNHKGSPVSADTTKVSADDEVLFALASFPYPNELAIEAPESATAGVPFTVRVVSYDEKGKRKPVAGATVTGAAGPTAADGTTTVSLSAPGRLSATHGKEIPASAAVCIAGACPS
ncbi:MAG TPA: hypothetical protein VF121_09395 [Thermoanaerobaculia bacterium]|nr:hypothetical protein [Thermoanaerobaculia bacterium]